MKFVFQIAALVFWTFISGSAFGTDDAAVFQSEKVVFRATTVVAGLEHPWAVAFLPNEELLITERPGRLRWYENGKLHQVIHRREIGREHFLGQLHPPIRIQIMRATVFGNLAR